MLMFVLKILLVAQAGKIIRLYITAQYKSDGKCTPENVRHAHTCAGRRVGMQGKTAVAGPGRDKMPAGFVCPVLPGAGRGNGNTLPFAAIQSRGRVEVKNGFDKQHRERDRRFFAWLKTRRAGESMQNKGQITGKTTVFNGKTVQQTFCAYNQTPQAISSGLRAKPISQKI